MLIVLYNKILLVVEALLFLALKNQFSQQTFPKEFRTSFLFFRTSLFVLKIHKNLLLYIKFGGFIEKVVNAAKVIKTWFP